MLVDKIIKTDAQWQGELSPEAFRIARKQGTERAFSGAYWDNHAPGTYLCVCCGQALFSSETKFESGTGWPSFFQALPKSIGQREDRSFFMTRVEYHCVRCGGHQGHVFEDGPKPTGLRYCNNGLALRFIGQGKPLPALRG